MRVFINAIPGVYRNAQYSLSEEGFKGLGVETILYFSGEELAGIRREDILIATKRTVTKRLEDIGAEHEILTHPEELLPFMSKSERLVDASTITEADLPAFIRPAKGVPFTSVAARGKACRLKRGDLLMELKLKAQRLSYVFKILKLVRARFVDADLHSSPPEPLRKPFRGSPPRS